MPTLGIEAVPLPPPTFQKLPLSGPSVPSTSSLGQGPVIRQMLMTLGLKGEGPELGSLLMLIEQFTQNLSVLVPLLKTAFGCL